MNDARPPFTPFVVNSLDGRRAIQFVDVWQPGSYPGGTIQRWVGRTEPHGNAIILAVPIDEFFGSPSFMHESRGLPSSGPEKIRLLGAATVGVYLDLEDSSTDVEPGGALDVIPAINAWGVLRELEPASVEDVLLYLGARVYWTWLFGATSARLDAADAIRLGYQGVEEVRRLAMAGTGAYWNRIDNPTALDLYAPTGRLIREFRSGAFPGLVRSPVAQITGLLDAPRYSSARVAFEKSAEFLAGDRQDLENAVKEAASGVESLGRIAFGLTGKVTLGEIIKEIRGLRVFDPPLDKALAALDALSGFRGDEAGVGHGGTEAPHVTREEAQFAINIAASVALLLLDVDSD